MRREYWTALDGSNGHHEISNFGRIRNAHTQVIKKCYIQKDGRKVFNMNCKDTEKKKVFIKRAVLEHFGEPLKRNQFVKLIDPNGDYSINNLKIYTWAEIESYKENNAKTPKRQSDSDWDKAITLTRDLCGGLYKGLCIKLNIEIDELINEALGDIMTDYDFGEKIDVNKLRKYCAKKIEDALRRLRSNRDARFDDYQIGINYIERDLYRANI